MAWRIMVIAGLSACGCAKSYSQTNDCTPVSQLFYLPSIHLRPENKPIPKDMNESRKAEPTRPAPELSLKPDANAQLSAAVSAERRYASFVREGEFYLTKTQSPFNNPIDRFVDNVFRPEVFQVGKLPASCSIWTAVKRKNPLCLLNPEFFQISW
jgi:hypothetical protein